LPSFFSKKEKFLSGQPVTCHNPDWHLIFARLGILDRAPELSGIFSAEGPVLLYVGFNVSIAAFFASGERVSQSRVFLYGSVLSVFHVLLFAQPGVS
jgi:hypothetical protein